MDAFPDRADDGRTDDGDGDRGDQCGRLPVHGRRDPPRRHHQRGSGDNRDDGKVQHGGGDGVDGQLQARHADDDDQDAEHRNDPDRSRYVPELDDGERVPVHRGYRRQRTADLRGNELRRQGSLPVAALG